MIVKGVIVMFMPIWQKYYFIAQLIVEPSDRSWYSNHAEIKCRSLKKSEKEYPLRSMKKSIADHIMAPWIQILSNHKVSGNFHS